MVKKHYEILPICLEKMIDLHRDMINIGCKSVKVDFLQFDDNQDLDFPNKGGFYIIANHFALGNIEHVIYPDGTFEKTVTN